MKIIYRDQNLAVLDKPAGILVHPVISTPLRRGTSFTLEVKSQKNTPCSEYPRTIVDFIIQTWPEIKNYDWLDNSRPGIVHRLDQDTSGLIVIAKNPKTLEFLQSQFKSRKVKKLYLTLVLGKVEPKTGEIVSYLSRDNSGTIKHKSTHFNFSWQKEKSKLAITKYHVINYYHYYFLHTTYHLTLLGLEIKTGRTHQIRTHLKSKNWPIIGDQIYNTKDSKKVSQKLDLYRQFLHSHKIKFELPDGETKEFESELPNDLKSVLDSLDHISSTQSIS